MNINKVFPPSDNFFRHISAVIFWVVFVIGTTSIRSVAQTPDPGLLGTHAVIKAEYDLGDAAYPPPAAAMFPINMEVRGSVHYPADMATGSKYPVLLWLHGRHETCYQTSNPSNTQSAWPCPTGWQSILSYEGYDYAAKTMASHGYIVISISANAINAKDGALADDGMNARGVLVQHHLDLWNGWNTTDTSGPFHSLFVGKLNMQNIGTMGHSRGGEGVIFNAEYNRSLGNPYGIRAILTLAPVDFYRHYVNGIPLLNIAPYCDGDVRDLEGVYFYDDARYKDTTDQMPKHSVLLKGANHNFFNSVWSPGFVAGGSDDWLYYYSNTDQWCGAGAPGSGRFDTTKQQAAYNTYAAAFYRLYLGHETQFAPILEVRDITPPASSTLDTSNVFVSYHAGHTDRLDVNTIDTVSDFTTNTVAGAVTTSGLTSPEICGGGLAQPVCDAGLNGRQKPHRGTNTIKGLGQMKLTWSDTTGSYQNDIPQNKQDITNYRYLTFRTCVNFSETTSGPDLNFTIQLIDSAGNKKSQVVNNFTNSLFYEPGTTSGDLPKLVFNTVSVPLDSFTGINLAKVRHIKFLFNKSAAGAVLVSDLALNNPVCGNLNAFFTDSIPTTGHKVFFTNKSTNSPGDTVTRLWHFGNPATGVLDTSTSQNPFHIYVTGTYTACLYVTVKRKNGLTCTDTFCTSVVMPVRAGITELTQPAISIVPNPAKDFIEVTGAEKTDVLKIINLYGQEVFSTTISQSRINLPQNITAGFYNLIVISPRGNVYQKLLINR